MYSYLSTTICEDEDEAGVLALSLRSIPHVDVKQNGATVFISFDLPSSHLLNEKEKENILLRMERIIIVFTYIPSGRA